MNKEAKKISKIVDELFLYFIKAGHKNINLNVDLNNDIIIQMTVDYLDHDKIKKLTERLDNKRELEVEEYGWELMGESDCSNELELIGLLVDSFSYKQVEDKFVLEFIRKRRK